MPEPSSIANFFHERKIFVTGATGFLGKVLVSKLLRSCKGIDIIYVLIRQKRNKDATDRFRDFLEDAVSHHIKFPWTRCRSRCFRTSIRTV